VRVFYHIDSIEVFMGVLKMVTGLIRNSILFCLIALTSQSVFAELADAERIAEQIKSNIQLSLGNADISSRDDEWGAYLLE